MAMKMLDAGCFGIICPMINTRADCEAFVGACRYPPRGYRSFGPVRAVTPGLVFASGPQYGTDPHGLGSLEPRVGRAPLSSSYSTMPSA